jgi:hypothetical protein
MNDSTAQTAWLDGLVLELTELDVMTDLDPGSLGWYPLLLPWNR